MEEDKGVVFNKSYLDRKTFIEVADEMAGLQLKTVEDWGLSKMSYNHTFTKSA